MGDMAEFCKELREIKKEKRRRLGMTCPECAIRLPKAHPKILLPNQKCWCGYVDKRERKEK